MSSIRNSNNSYRSSYAYGHIHYKNGNKSNGSISCAGTFAWRVIKVLEDDLEVEYLSGNKVN